MNWPGTTALTRQRGFAVATSVLGLFLFAAAAPTPLYGDYATRWHFSRISLTAVFAVYALALLATLLTCGTLSDALGRRPVILLSLGVMAVANVAFLAAEGLAWLYLARILQGLATGLMTAAVAATLIDLQPSERPALGATVNAVTPTFGLGAGALGSSLLVQYGPTPTRLVYALILTGVIACAALLLLVPEPVAKRHRPALTVRLTMEPALRAPFLAALPCLVATWALGGLYLSLGPAIAATLTHSGNHVVGGAAVAALAMAGGATSLAVAGTAPRRAMLAGCASLTAGAVITVIGVGTTSSVAFFAGSAVAGTGFGAAFLGSFRTLAGLATPQGRAGLVSAIYISAYLAFSVPAVAAGILSTHIGLTTTAVGYGTAVAVLATAAGLATARTTPPRQPAPTRAGRSGRSPCRADQLSVNDPTTR